MKILVVTNEFDYAISDFFKYLLKFNINFKRVNGQNLNTEEYLKIEINSNHSSFSYFMEYCYYFRKSPMPNLSPYTKLSSDLAQHFNSEIRQIKEDIFRLLCKDQDITILGRNNFGLHDISKIDVLLNAKIIGLTIPETIITSSTIEIIEFFNIHKTIISKPIFGGSFIKDLSPNTSFNMYTEIINEEDIKRLKNNTSVFPSIIQKYIEKLFEIRVYIIGELFFPMAIFSQSSKKTTTDFRNHDFQNPNKIVPFQLSSKIKSQLSRLMKKYQLNNASIDLIYSTDNKIYFLEINPFGQFGYYTKCCNYFIEKEIISYLTTYENI